jgi:hypothetical protein
VTASAQRQWRAHRAVFLNEDEPYRVSHPLKGGDFSLSITVGAAALLELAPDDYLLTKDRLTSNRSRLRIDARTQASWHSCVIVWIVEHSHSKRQRDSASSLRMRPRCMFSTSIIVRWACV